MDNSFTISLNIFIVDWIYWVYVTFTVPQLHVEVNTCHQEGERKHIYNAIRDRKCHRDYLPLKPADQHTSTHTLLTRVALGGERSTVERETAVLSPAPSPPTTPPLPRSKRGL